MIGEVIHERYKIEELIKEESMSSVYLALDLSLGKSCLVEIISFHSQDAENIPAYLKQLQELKLHYHPQIPRLQEVFTIEDDLWPKLCLISQQVDARPLDQVLEQQGRFSEVETVSLLLQLARIVEYLHGLTPPHLHQGIHPGHVLIGKDQKLYLTGYSLMRQDADGKHYPLNPIPDYIAPEQLRGEPGVTTDLYAIGLTGVEMVAGKHYTQLPSQDIHASINVSTEFGNTLKRLVQEDPAQRIQSATALKNELMHVKRIVEEKQRDITVDAPIQKKQLLVPAIAGGVALLAVVILAFKLMTQPSQPAQANLSSAEATQAAAARKERLTRNAENPGGNPASPAASADGQNALEAPVNIYTDFEYKANDLPAGIPVAETELVTDPKPAETLTAEPAYDGSGTVYGKFDLGSGVDHTYVFAVNGSKLYVDKNNNEDLTDDGPPDGLNGSVDLKLEIPSPAGTPVMVPYRIQFSPNTKGGFQFSSHCYYAGKLKVDDQSFDAVSFESEGQNGLLQNDGLWVDLNKNGNFDSIEHFQNGMVVTSGNHSVKIKLNYP